MKRHITRIYYWWVDPFDDKLLCEGSLHYDKRASANGWYHKFLGDMKKQFIIPCWKELEGRNPKLVIKIV